MLNFVVRINDIERNLFLHIQAIQFNLKFEWGNRVRIHLDLFIATRVNHRLILVIENEKFRCFSNGRIIFNFTTLKLFNWDINEFLTLFLRQYSVNLLWYYFIVDGHSFCSFIQKYFVFLALIIKNCKIIRTYCVNKLLLMKISLVELISVFVVYLHWVFGELYLKFIKFLLRFCQTYDFLIKTLNVFKNKLIKHRHFVKFIVKFEFCNIEVMSYKFTLKLILN